MISLQNISIHFGGTYLFEEISFLINKNDKIGLVGKNGAGKSTLLKILARQQEPDSGQINYPKDCTVGYLRQELQHLQGKTVWQETETAFNELKEVDAQIHELMEIITHATNHESEEYHDQLNALHEATMRFEELGGNRIESEIEKVLLGLGFERNEFTRPCEELSGGWQMRIELAKILLRKPNLILLDEPTNHLDIEAIQWLEVFLKNYEGAVILVSHDRAFLDAVTSRTVEITNGQAEDYKAPYSKYVALRKERRETVLNAQRNQQREIEKTEQLIEKFRYKASKAKFAQSLIKQLDRMDRIDIEDEDASSIHFRFPEAPRSGQLIMEAKNLSKTFGKKEVLKNVNFQILRGERIAFVGKNGEGKTTLTKLLMKDEEISGGEIIFGHNIKIGYYAQHQADRLDGNDTVFETIDNKATGDMRTRVRNLLGAFLFSGEAADKKVKVLSGGEKSRLALCCLLLEKYNVLVLDEPTNHLDMRSKDVLKEALQSFEGTLIIVSHDRDFLNGLTNKVYYFKNGNVTENIGGIYEFLEKQQIGSLRELERKNSTSQQSASSVEKNSVTVKKKSEKEIKQLERKVKKSEEEIKRLEEALALVEKKLSQPALIQSDQQTIYAEYEKLKTRLDTEMENWTNLEAELGNK
jgi:ATP-binding cassette, subfamily F, member 3